MRPTNNELERGHLNRRSLEPGAVSTQRVLGQLVVIIIRFDYSTPRSYGMKKMAADLFKARCLAVVDEVQAKHETVVITKNGKPVAKLIPVSTEVDEIYNFLSGKGSVTEDVVSPAISPKEWGDLE